MHGPVEKWPRVHRHRDAFDSLVYAPHRCQFAWYDVSDYYCPSKSRLRRTPFVLLYCCDAGHPNGLTPALINGMTGLR